jgi:hypothetical protein
VEGDGIRGPYIHATVAQRWHRVDNTTTLPHDLRRLQRATMSRAFNTIAVLRLKARRPRMGDGGSRMAPGRWVLIAD